MSLKDNECYLGDETIHYNEEIVQSKTLNDLPEEVLHIIFELLPVNDLETCMNVCTVWRCILNKNKIWKKHCWYPEKVFKSMLFKHDEKSKSTGMCKWRKNVQCQKVIWENWRTGRYSTTKTDIHIDNMTSAYSTFINENGDYWFLSNGQYPDKIYIWNITDEPILHQNISVPSYVNKILYFEDKVVFFHSDHIEVYEFEHLEHKLKPAYRLNIEMNDILQDDAVNNHADDNVSNYILVDKRFLIGHQDQCMVTDTDHKTFFIHVWDLKSCSKIGTLSPYQESFDDFIQSWSVDDDITMILSSGDNARFVVSLIGNISELCHVSLFSTTEMKFLQVVCREKGVEFVSCLMKGDIIFLLFQCRNYDRISIYNVNTGLLHQFDNKLGFSFSFDHDRVLFNGYDDQVKVLTLSDGQVKKHEFKINPTLTVLNYFYPRFLLLSENVSIWERNVSVWDIESGVKLWNFPPLSDFYSCKSCIQQFEYPSRLLVLFKGERQFSLLKFDKPEQE